MRHRLPSSAASLCGIMLLAGFLRCDPAAGRPFAVADVLRAEAIAQVLVDPQQRWLVIEQRRAAGTAPRFDLETHDMLTLGRLLVVDLRHPAAARALIKAEPDTGYVAGSFSPGGTRLAVMRLRRHRWELGVIVMATGRVHWLEVTPGLAVNGRALQWLSETTLVALVHQPGDLPLYLRAGWQTKAELPRRWALAAAGTGVTATPVGSGRFRSVVGVATPRQLIRLDVATGHSQVMSEGAITDFEVSPDHRRVAVLAEAEPIPLVAGASVGVGTTVRRLRLRLVDVQRQHSLTVGNSFDIAGSLLSWSPSGRTLLIFARRDGLAWTQGDIVAVDGATAAMAVATGTSLRPVISGPPDYAPMVRAYWMGEAIVLDGQAAGQTASDWYRLGPGGPVVLTRPSDGPAKPTAINAQRVIVEAANAVWQIDGAGRRVLLPGSAGRVAVPEAVADDGSRVAASHLPAARLYVQADATTSTLAVDFGGATPFQIKATDGRIAALAGAPRRRLLVAEQIDGHGVGRIVIADARGRLTTVTHLNRHLANVDPARPMPVHSDGPDGPQTSWLYLPATPPPVAGYPLVVIPYPGRVFADRPPRSADPDQPLANISVPALAGRGYAVLLPSLAATAPGVPAAEGLTARLLRVVDAAVQNQVVDGARVALWGHSFGGYAAAVIATQSSRFRSVIASAGLFDLTSLYGTFLPPRRLHPEDGLSVDTMAGWSEHGQPHLGAAPWLDPAVYVANSPVFHADRIGAPMLLLQGDQDIAALSQAEEMFSALYRQDKDAVLVSYWGEGHVVAGPANLRDLYRRVFDWLAATLPPAPERALSQPGTSAAPMTRSPPWSGSPYNSPQPPALRARAALQHRDDR